MSGGSAPDTGPESRAAGHGSKVPTAGSTGSGFLGAVQFLTRIPVKLPAPIPHVRVVPWFPIVGALVGGVVGAIAWGLGQVTTMAVAAAVAVVFGLLATGAFHDDGLADIADAFGGGWTREQRLKILKDPRHGTYGVAALTSSILLRVVAVAALSPTAAAAGLVAAHTLGRSAAVATMLVAPVAGEAGLGAGHARDVRPASVVVGIVAGVAISTGAILWAGLPAWTVVAFVGAAAVAAAGVTTLAVRKVGGINGDVLGAIEQVAEITILVAATIIA